ncbi:MAG: glycoside hydrolase family 3 N-terminal domain-containing protein [Cyanobacteria bacterium J06641_5]
MSSTASTKKVNLADPLSLSEMVAQLVVVRASGHLFDSQIAYPHWEPPAAKLRHWVQDLNVGGVILLGGSAPEVALRVQQLQSWAETPLLMAADIEEGVGQRFGGASWFPPPMALGAIAAQQGLSVACQLARQFGEATAREALAIGLNWVLAPVADVNNNPQNPVINVRAFGDDPSAVSQLVTAFIDGAQSQPVLACAKHFPGHGDTAIDSHLELPSLEVDRNRLETVELAPFRAAIAAGVATIMSGHLRVPAWDDRQPATTSPAILQGQLRDRLGFEGLIATDALIMGALAPVAAPEELPILALEAGADILLMPADPEAAISAVVAAVESGRLPVARVRASYDRVAAAKAKLVPAPSPQALPDALDRPETTAVVEKILTSSLQWGGILPAAATANLIVTADDLLGCDYLSRSAPAIAWPQQFGCTAQIWDCERFVTGEIEPGTLLQLFARGNPFRGRAGLPTEAWQRLVQLLAAHRLGGVILYGSPYLLDALKPHLGSQNKTTWAFSYGQMPAAQAIALQKILAWEQPPTTTPENFL